MIPPTLLEKLESYELSEIKTQMFNCLKKIYILCVNIANTVRDLVSVFGVVGTEIICCLKSLANYVSHEVHVYAIIGLLFRNRDNELASAQTIDGATKRYGGGSRLVTLSGQYFLPQFERFRVNVDKRLIVVLFPRKVSTDEGRYA